jgi:hypothetical protein
MKKILIVAVYIKKIFCTKKFKIMRNTLLLLLLNVFQILGNNNNTYSQSTTLTMNLMDVSVKEVLLEIEAQSDFFFLYNSKLIDVDKKVNLSVKKQKIDNILADLFNNTDVEHVVFNREIILTSSDYDVIKKEFQQKKHFNINILKIKRKSSLFYRVLTNVAIVHKVCVKLKAEKNQKS